MATTGMTVPAFRWRSTFGVGTVFFLANGAINIFAALFVPLTLHLGGAAAVPGLVLSEEADTALLGRSVADIAARDPHLGVYLVSFMDTMCAFMMVFGIAYVAIAWAALRRSEPWAYWTLVVSGIAWVPYYLVIAQTYAANGVRTGLGEYGVALFALPAIVGAILARPLAKPRGSRARG